MQTSQLAEEKNFAVGRANFTFSRADFRAKREDLTVGRADFIVGRANFPFRCFNLAYPNNQQKLTDPIATLKCSPVKRNQACVDFLTDPL